MDAFRLLMQMKCFFIQTVHNLNKNQMRYLYLRQMRYLYHLIWLRYKFSQMRYLYLSQMRYLYLSQMRYLYISLINFSENAQFLVFPNQCFYKQTLTALRTSLYKHYFLLNVLLADDVRMMVKLLTCELTEPHPRYQAFFTFTHALGPIWREKRPGVEDDRTGTAGLWL